MSDNQDLKSKILLMRQKNFGELVNEAYEKNDNEKPENNEINKDEVLTESDENKVEADNSNLENRIQVDINSEISDFGFHLQTIQHYQQPKNGTLTLLQVLGLLVVI